MKGSNIAALIGFLFMALVGILFFSGVLKAPTDGTIVTTPR
jgi:hypothetical protein